MARKESAFCSMGFGTENNPFGFGHTHSGSSHRSWVRQCHVRLSQERSQREMVLGTCFELLECRQFPHNKVFDDFHGAVNV